LGLAQHPGWALYSQVLADRRNEEHKRVLAALRGGNLVEAKLHALVYDVLSDCIDLPKIEAENYKLTLASINLDEAVETVETERRVGGASR
jgi:hypothetical protein